MASRWIDPERFFNPADREAIADAAHRAEGATSGEIVPYVVGRCDDYRDASWCAAAWGGVAAAAAAGSIHFLGGFWGGSVGLWATVPVVVGAGLGYLLASWLPGLRRTLVPPTVLESRVERRAALAFVTEEVFATRERTGILIFLALFERRVVVLADAGINAKVDQSEWDGIVADLRDGIRAGRPAAALVAAIGACGRLLAQRKVEIRSDDTNELPDALRMADD